MEDAIYEVGVEQQKVVVERIQLVPQYHPCSWCGGYTVRVPKKDKDEEIVIGLVVSAPPKELRDLVACRKCLWKLFNSTLGQAQFKGQEMAELKGEKENTGFFPARKDGRG